MRWQYAIIVALLFLIGCRSHKDVIQISETHKEESADSIRSEYIERIIFIPDTVYAEISDQRAERVTADSISFLENDYAWSYASITAEGLLYHSLFTKPQLIPVVFDKPVTLISNNNSHISQKTKADSIDKSETKTEYVERELTWWQKTQIGGFWAAIILLIILYRRKIFKAIVRLFTKK